MKNYKNSLIIILFFSILIYSCEKEDKRKEEEITKLNEYITTNNITTEPTASGLYYIETIEGSGEQAIAGKTVKVYYTGRLIDGTIFDSNMNTGQPFSFVVGESNVIQGWHEGISYMKEGGKATLIIPSELAYKDKSLSVIQPYSTLIFDIEVFEVY